MDLICPNCREPWDNETLHEVVEEIGGTYDKLYKEFRTKGCGVAFRGSSYETGCSVTADPLLSELADLLGDDADGYMAMCEDAELLGLLD